MPPNFATAASTAAWIWSSDRTSTTQASARPPAFSISSAAEWIVPGSLGCGSAVLAATTTFAPSRGRAQPDGLADAPARAGDEERLAFERRHGPGTLAAR